MSFTDAVATARAIASGQTSADEVLSSTLDRIRAVDPVVHAIAGLEPEPLEVAWAADGPLSGVPLLVKDLLPLAGRRVGFGSRLFRGHVAPEGSPYASALERAGLRAIGRTTSSELGLLGSTESLACGVTRNPWDLERSATGSSGGAAVAVATGMVPMAHASDGGGSIRIPASATGTFGFKPSRGRCLPALPPGPIDLLIDHCISRTVRDSAALLAATEDPSHRARCGLVERPLERRLRIAVYRETLFGEAPHPEVDAALRATARRLAELGHRPEEVPGPRIDARAVSDAFFLLSGASVAALMQQVAPLLGRLPGSDELEPFTLALAQRATAAGPGAVPGALAALAVASGAFLAWLAPWDVALCPTMPDLPPPLGHLAPTLDVDLLLRRTERLAGYTPIHSIAGAPAMSVPVGWSSEGLPIGMHFAGREGDDALLLGLAYELEAEMPWIERVPSLRA